MAHHEIRTATLSARDGYRLMTDLIAPRPIAWVASQNPDGRDNLAPFSYYQAVCSSPPTLTLSFSWHPDGRPKDTLRNILETREFTISHVHESFLHPMNQTSGNYPSELSEWDLPELSSLKKQPSTLVKPPFVKQAKAALECELVHAIPLGRGKNNSPSATLAIAEVLCFHVDGALLNYDNNHHILPISQEALAPLSRLGGATYGLLREFIDLPRPRP